jgi:Fe-S-cluster-containing hydrogenase component 2
LSRSTIGHDCDHCGGCAGVCPENAITVFETSVMIDKTLCSNCSSCIKMCPAGAMKSMFKKIKVE